MGITTVQEDMYSTELPGEQYWKSQIYDLRIANAERLVEILKLESELWNTRQELNAMKKKNAQKGEA